MYSVINSKNNKPTPLGVFEWAVRLPIVKLKNDDDKISYCNCEVKDSITSQSLPI